MAHTIGDETKVVRAVAPSAGGAGTMTAVEVDANGYDRCRFIVNVGAATNTGTLDAYVQSATSSGGSFANTTSAALTQIADTGGNTVHAIDIPVNSARPYLKLIIVTTTAAVANSAVAELYRGTRKQNVTTAFTQEVVL